MMRYLKFIIIIAASLFFTNCERDAEVQPKEYPYVITNSPTVNSNGAEFSADITNIGNQEILKYGFVWSTEPNPTIQDYNKIFDDKANKGIYTCNVNYGLAKGQTYYVRAYILTDQYEVYGNVKSFNSQGSLPPVIDDFEPKFGPIGTEVTIEGKNFALLKNGNKVKFGDIEVLVDSVSENIMKVKIPPISKPEMVQVTIETAGMTVTSQDSFDLWFPWKKIGTFNIDLYGAASFSYGDRGYIIQRNSNDLQEYNPQANTFSSYGSLPESASSNPLAACYETKAIVLLNSNVYEFDLNSFNWSLITNYPYSRTEDDYLFYFNNEIFLGSFGNGTLYKFNLSQNLWSQVSASDIIDPYYYSYYSMDNEGYIFYGTFRGGTSIYKYSPDSDSWKYLTSYPFASQAWSSQFMINSLIYAGFGYTNDWDEGYSSNQIWEFNSENKRWSRYHDCPQRMDVELSLSINGKGYVFSMNGPWYNDLSDVWEFDPTKN